jgi:F0F1-type ATP synthase membrane subunit b/b'
MTAEEANSPAHREQMPAPGAHRVTRGQALADATALLHTVRERVASARPLPMSGSVMVHKKEILDELDRLARALPVAYDEARQVLDERESVIDEGRAEAARLLARAEEERSQLVRDHDLHKDASEAAQSVVGAAHGAADRARNEVDDYVDRRLAQLEVTLTRTLSQVSAGRRHLVSGDEGSTARALGELGDDGS